MARVEDDDYRSGADSAARYKAARLCRQAKEALTLGLLECGDGILLDVQVLAVEPFPDASRLAVRVEGPPGHDPSRVLAALARAHGKLRSEVAAALQRKRAPELVFRLAGPDQVPPSAR